MSCLVWREKSEAGGRVAPELEGPLAALREAARRVAKVFTPGALSRATLLCTIEEARVYLGVLSRQHAAQVAVDAKMALDVEEYVASFRTDLCDAVAAWTRGGRFADIMKMTEVFEVRAHAALLCWQW